MTEWLKSLTLRERLFGLVAGFATALFLGHLAADFFLTDFKWGDLGAMGAFVVAATALGIGIIGYLDSRRSQRLEYKAYIRVDIAGAALETRTNMLQLFLLVTNNGRTPAQHLYGRARAVIWSPPQVHGTSVDFKPSEAKSEVFSQEFVSSGPSHAITCVFEDAFDSADGDLLRNGISTLYIEVDCHYDSVFGVKEEDVFRAKFKGTLPGRSFDLAADTTAQDWTFDWITG